MITSGENGDSEGDGCNLGLTGIDGDELGVKNGPDGDNIPLNSNKKKKTKIQKLAKPKETK